MLMDETVKRIFVGIPLIINAETLSQISIIKQEIQSFNAKWVAEKNYHLTISFIGETTTKDVNTIAQVLRNANSQMPEFDLKIQGLGVFPNVKNAKVLWLGFEQNKTLDILVNNTQKWLATTGNFSLPQEYKAHLTLARFYTPPNANALKKILEKYKNEVFGQIHINHFCLYESIFQNISVTYAEIEKYFLNQN